MWKEFKEFALKGNVVDLAVGVIIGAAFGKIVESLVSDIIMPIIGKITGGVDFSNMFLQLGKPGELSIGEGAQHAANLEEARKMGATLAYGNFLTLAVNFLIVAFVLFMVIKGINKMKRQAPPPPPAPEVITEVQVLEQIRDLLASKK